MVEGDLRETSMAGREGQRLKSSRVFLCICISIESLLFVETSPFGAYNLDVVEFLKVDTITTS